MVQIFEKLSTKGEINMEKTRGNGMLNESIQQAHEKLKTIYAEMVNKGNIAQMAGDTLKYSVKMA